MLALGQRVSIVKCCQAGVIIYGESSEGASQSLQKRGTNKPRFVQGSITYRFQFRIEMESDFNYLSPPASLPTMPAHWRRAATFSWQLVDLLTVPTTIGKDEPLHTILFLDRLHQQAAHLLLCYHLRLSIHHSEDSK